MGEHLRKAGFVGLFRQSDHFVNSLIVLTKAEACIEGCRLFPCQEDKRKLPKDVFTHMQHLYEDIRPQVIAIRPGVVPAILTSVKFEIE